MENNFTSIRKITIISIGALIISVIVLAGSLIFWAYSINEQKNASKEETTEMLVRTALGKQEKVIPDEYTTVWLNSASILKYNVGRNRHMSMTGEAFFNIKEGISSFALQIGEGTIETTNATFKVEAYPADEYVKITLYDGVLSLKFKQLSKEMFIERGMEMLINSSTARMKLLPAGVRGPSWIINKYETVSLNAILYSLADYYGVNIVIDRNDLSDMFYSFTFEGNKTLEEVMAVIKVVSDKIDYRIQGQELMIY